MCGLCGVYYFDHERVVDERDISAMRETMVHRGPDDAGNFVRGHVGLGHRRLSIVDLDGGHQPMCNEDGSVWIVFNGEIYNHRELRDRLIAKGHVFRSQSDTEAIVHLYEEEGAHAVTRLHGMFALALYDLRAGSLLLARDRIGIKPLYYQLTPQALVFASEVKAILAWPGSRAEINWPRLPDLLRYGTVYGGETLFRGIEELPPGHVLLADEDGTSIRQYWELPEGAAEAGDEAEQRERTRDLLRLSVRRRLMSDVPLGAFLSGGLDSSLIVALMTELSDSPVKTFSIGFRDEGYEEFRYSRLVAQRFRTDHTEVVLDAEQFCDALPDLVWYHDEPVALRASVPLYFLSRVAKEKATVILTGEGADELFLGYDHYGWARHHAQLAAAFQRLVPAALRSPFLGLARHAVGDSHRLLGRLAMSPGAVAASFIRWVDDATVASIYPGAAPYLPDVCASIFNRAPAGGDFLSGAAYLHFKTFLLALLMKQDKMSMAASIESRVPFLDHELVEYGYRLPTSRKLRNGQNKVILKEVAAQYLPPELVEREKKGFPVPLVPWLRAPSTRRRFEEILFDPRTVARGMFARAGVEQCLLRCSSDDSETARSASYLIWNLVNFELWQRAFIDAPPGAAARRHQTGPPPRAGARSAAGLLS